MRLVGAVHYGRNGHHVASLMHVDHTLPMWAFFDVYGSVQKIKLLGQMTMIVFLARDAFVRTNCRTTAMM